MVPLYDDAKEIYFASPFPIWSDETHLEFVGKLNRVGQPPFGKVRTQKIDQLVGRGRFVFAQHDDRQRTLVAALRGPYRSRIGSRRRPPRASPARR